MTSSEPYYDVKYDSTKNIGIILDSIGPEYYNDIYEIHICLQCKKMLGFNYEAGNGNVTHVIMNYSILQCPNCKETYCCSEHMKPIIDYNASPIDSTPLSKDLINDACLEYLHFLISVDMMDMCAESEVGFPEIDDIIEGAVKAFVEENGEKYNVKKEILLQIPKTYLRCNACKTISDVSSDTDDNK